MSSFTVNVVSDGEDGRIPVKLAAQVMIGTQEMLADIGEYLVAKELRIQDYIHSDLLDRFVLYMDEAGGISLNSSVPDPQTSGHGNIVEDAVALMDATLTAMSTGIGTYWLEEKYTDPFYRNNIIVDILALSNLIENNPGYSIMFGSDEPKRFGGVDTARLAAYMKEKGGTANGATLGILVNVPSKSKGDMLYLQCGKDRARLSFSDRGNMHSAKQFVGMPVIIGGQLMYSKDGSIMEIRNASGTVAADSIKFRRLISCDGDVILKTPVKADISYSSGAWTLSNEDLGISCSKEDWDGAVQSFHDYFIFLWTQYADKDLTGMSDEEREIGEYLNALL